MNRLSKMNSCVLTGVLKQVEGVLYNETNRTLVALLGILSPFTGVDLLLATDLKVLVVARTECESDKSRPVARVVYDYQTKQIVVVMAVHVSYKDAHNIHTDGTDAKVNRLAAVITANLREFVVTFELSDVVESVRVVFAGDWNNSGFRKTPCGPDAQGLRTMIGDSSDEKLGNGVVGMKTFWRLCETGEFSDETDKLLPNVLAYPVGVPTVDDPHKVDADIHRIITSEDTLAVMSQHLAAYMYAPIPALLIHGDHPNTRCAVAPGVLVAVHAMCGYGPNGFNGDPLYGMKLRQRVPPMISEAYRISAKKAKDVAFAVQNEVTKKVCHYLDIPYDQRPYNVPENIPIFDQVLRDQIRIANEELCQT